MTAAGGRANTTAPMAIAAVLIANSHLERFYPHPWVAGDGLLGNALFFFTAGTDSCEARAA